MREEEPFAERRPGSQLPALAELRSAVAYATLFGGRPSLTETLERGALFVPLVGFAVGAALVGIDRLLDPLSPPLRAPVLVVALAALRGHVRARFWSAGRGTPAAEPGRAPARRHGPAIAWLALQIAKCAAIAGLGTARVPALLFAPMLGGWSSVVCAFGARDAAAPSSGRKFARGVTFREFALASVYSFAVIFAVNEALGIALALCAALSTVGLRVLWHRYLGGVTETRVQLTGEVVEVAVLALFAGLARR